MQGSVLRRVVNYRVFVVSETIVSIAMGLFGPFFIVFIQNFGDSFISFGYAVSIMLFVSSGVAYFAGRLADHFGRKLLMVSAGLCTAGIIVLYTIIDSLAQLYILQALYGAVTAIDATAGSAFMGDTTEQGSRGTDIGKRNAITGIAGACALAAGGHMIGWLGFEAMFYLIAGLSVISSLVLLFIKEEKNE